LQQLAEQFGRRLVYDVINDRVLVTPIGIGNNLPNGYVKQYGASIKQIAVPDGIMVIGDKTKYQMRLLLEPVARDWDGSWQLLHDLSYAPVMAGAVQETMVQLYADLRETWETLLSAGFWDLTINGVLLSYNSMAGQDLYQIRDNLITLVNGSNNPAINGVLIASADPDASNPALILTGVPLGAQFQVQAVLGPGSAAESSDGASMDATLTQAACFGRRGFDNTDPPTFSDVVSTPRLTYHQAIKLAQEDVFSCYRVRAVDASGGGPITVPGYGPILRREQLLLTDSQVSQIVPVLPNKIYQRNDQILNPNVIGADGAQPAFSEDFVENFYDGYSRDLPAVVYGTFNEAESDVAYLHEFHGNTPGNERVFIDFKIAEDPRWQVIRFVRPVFRFAGGGRVVPGNLTLETGCYLRDNVTNQFVVYTQSRLLRPKVATTFFETSFHPDVQLGIIGQYQFKPSKVTLDGSGLTQQSAVTFINTLPNSVIGSAFIWTVIVDQTEYTYTNAPTDTPLTVATAFKGLIPNSPTIIVELMTTAAPNILPPVQNPVSSRLTGSLAAGNHYFTCTAITELGETLVSNEQGIAISTPNNTAVISWNPVQNATGYNVYWTRTSGTYSRRLTASGLTPAAWQLATAYVAGNLVAFNDNVYSCRLGNTGNTPPNATFWTLLGTIAAQQLELVFSQPLESITMAPPGVNTAAIPINTAWLRISGLQSGFSFQVDASVSYEPVEGLPPVLSAVASIVRTPVGDLQDYVSILTGATILENDPLFRANYYLDGMMLKYQTKVVTTVEYNTIMAIPCDGAITQVTWDVGGGKPVRTIASVNCEHSDVVRPYPDRRRAEGLPVVPNPNTMVPPPAGA
jgi:hypothetical protein